MTKKRKSVAARLDEFDRTLYTSFCNAANSLSQLYSHSMSQQKLAFYAGERHGLENLCQWILRQHEDGLRVTGSDVLVYLQILNHNEFGCGGEDLSLSPRFQSQNQLTQLATGFMNTSIHGCTGSTSHPSLGHGTRSVHSDNKDSVFSNDLGNSIGQDVDPYHISEVSHDRDALPSENAIRNNEPSSHSQDRDSNSQASSESSMDIHS